MKKFSRILMGAMTAVVAAALFTACPQQEETKKEGVNTAVLPANVGTDELRGSTWNVSSDDSSSANIISLNVALPSFDEDVIEEEEEDTDYESAFNSTEAKYVFDKSSSKLTVYNSDNEVISVMKYSYNSETKTVNFAVTQITIEMEGTVYTFYGASDVDNYFNKMISSIVENLLKSYETMGYTKEQLAAVKEQMTAMYKSMLGSSVSLVKHIFECYTSLSYELTDTSLTLTNICAKDLAYSLDQYVTADSVLTLSSLQMYLNDEENEVSFTASLKSVTDKTFEAEVSGSVFDSTTYQMTYGTTGTLKAEYAFAAETDTVTVKITEATGECADYEGSEFVLSYDNSENEVTELKK